MIKLDFWPQLHKDSYAKYPTLGFTSYIITKKGASNFIDNKIVYYPDSDANFYYNLNLYNHKKIVFYQDWENTDSSVHTSANNYNPLSHINDGMNIKTIRIGDYDIILSFIININFVYIIHNITKIFIIFQ